MLKARQKLGKYRIQRRLAEGGFAVVYQAFDTIEGIPVALKVPHRNLLSEQLLRAFRSEVRLTAQLEHPNILPIKNASLIDDHFVIAYPLGERTLADRLHHRIGLRTAVDYIDQMLAAVAYAHARRILHLDIKPENFILFGDGRLRLADFGIARVAARTRSLRGSGTGTVGYMAPEQALGKPSFSSDVFSLGLVIYRMLSGQLPEWPYEWPPPGYDRLKRLHPDLIAMLRRTLRLEARKRYRDAVQMEAAFSRIRRQVLAHGGRRRRSSTSNGATTARDWRLVRWQQFRRRFGKVLQLRSRCGRCGGPVSEVMAHCPWCGTARALHRGPTTFPGRCSRCKRGMKRDWRYCPWCYGAGVEPSRRRYTDKRYTHRCPSSSCRGPLMRFMRYCPWCHIKLRRKWSLPESRSRCRRCGWGVAADFWDHCAWCGSDLGRVTRHR